MTVDARSYTSASTFPWKLFRLGKRIAREGLRPLHLQLSPTNRCNADCSYCSCAEIDRKEELAEEELLASLDYFARLGTRAVTITGGGEPTLYDGLRRAIAHASGLGMAVGLVTNGLRWGMRRSHVVPDLAVENELLTWARVSIPERVDASRASTMLRRVTAELPDVDIGVSLTIGEEPDLDLVDELCELSEELPLTHVRLVQEILDLPKTGIESLVSRCEPYGKVIVQPRDDFTPGAMRCHISKLKPFLAADGYIYPCCGVQYADGADRCFPERFRMSAWREFSKAETFDGSRCQKCYYGAYNDALDSMLRPMEHVRFV